MAQDMAQEHNLELTPAQKVLLVHFRILDADTRKDKLSRIIRMRDGGAKIDGLELAKEYEELGYHVREEVSKSTWDFCDELTRMYQEVRHRNAAEK